MVFPSRPMAKRAVIAAGILLGASCLASCSASPKPPSASAPSAKQGRAADPANPATWTLPIEAYLPSDDEHQQITRARNALIDDCMQTAGFADWQPAPELPKMGGKTMTDWRYGIHDGALAKKRGYKPDAAEQAAYDAVMHAGAVDGTGGNEPEAKELAGCGSKAGAKISGNGEEFSQTAQDLGNEANIRAKQDPSVIAAFGAWSACMKQSGYSYKEPLDASDDPKFSSQEPTALEIATATADIACRNRTHVAKIWYDAEVKLQNAAVEKNAETLDRARKDLDAVVKNAAAVLAGTR